MLLRVAACSYEGSLFGWDINRSSTSTDHSKEVTVEEADHTNQNEVF